MEIDPDYPINDAYDGFDDNEPEPEFDGEPDEEYDDDGNLIGMVTAAGFGYHMAHDEIEERRIAEDILKKRDGKLPELKIPLHKRHEKSEGLMTPFGRWATKVNHDPSKINEDIEYTMEERLQIIRAEGEGHD